MTEFCSFYNCPNYSLSHIKNKKMSATFHTDRCINPFRKPGEKGHLGKDLRVIPKFILDKFPDIPTNSKICSGCRKKSRTKLEYADMSLDESNDCITNMECDESSLAMDIDNSNISHDGGDNLRSPREIGLEEMLDGLKQKFSSLKHSDPLRVRILTVAPSSWGVRKIAQEFGASRFLAKKSKELKSNHGVLADTTTRDGKVLPQTTVNKIIEFYNSDINSRKMPGMKDAISLIIDGERTKVQKCLLLLNLKELHVSFKESNPKYDGGFSTFAKLKPRNCILAGTSGTHSVCVCTIHENIKLMIDAIDVRKLTENTNKPLSNYKDCLNEIMCKEPSPDCYLDKCDQCPGTTEHSTKLSKLLDDSCISHVQCSSWTGTDRSTLLTQQVKVDEFINELCNRLQILKPHSFIAKQQTLFISEKKKNLREGEKVIVMFDFSENYSYVCQDASQAFHFNNDQCTVFSVIYYYKENSELKHKSNVFLSESLKHDTAAVYTVQTLLIPEIKKDVKNLKKIIYMIDGAKQHFKNTFQIANLVHHKEDFNVQAEWHYSATAHGKSSYDGIGATFKREAYKASLVAKPQDAILTPQVLFNWARKHFKNIKVFYFKKTDHERIRRKLNKRFEIAQSVPQILKNHGFIAEGENNVLIKRYSNDTNGTLW